MGAGIRWISPAHCQPLCHPRRRPGISVFWGGEIPAFAGMTRCRREAGWIAGTSPAMTMCKSSRHLVRTSPSGRGPSLRQPKMDILRPSPSGLTRGLYTCRVVAELSVLGPSPRMTCGGWAAEAPLADGLGSPETDLPKQPPVLRASREHLVRYTNKVRYSPPIRYSCGKRL